MAKLTLIPSRCASALTVEIVPACEVHEETCVMCQTSDVAIALAYITRFVSKVEQDGSAKVSILTVMAQDGQSIFFCCLLPQ